MLSFGRLLPRIAGVCCNPSVKEPLTRHAAGKILPCFKGLSTLANKPLLCQPPSQSSSLLTRWSQNQHLVAPVNPAPSASSIIAVRHFHGVDSKLKYLDFRYRFKVHHLRLHLLIIRRQKMKKHKRRKFRRKFKCLLAKKRLKREIAKEKAFRVELLTIIRRAEQFDPREYALRKIAEVNNKPREKTKQETYDEIKELTRVNRYQTQYIKPKHKRCDTLDLNQM